MAHTRRWGVKRLVCSAALVALAVSGCQAAAATPGASTSGGSAASATASTVGAAAAVSFTPESGSTKVRPDQPVTVSVVNGTLSSVTVTSDKGTTVAGTMDASSGQWTAQPTLQPDSTYTVNASVRSADGTTQTKSSTFVTLTPTKTASAVLIPGDAWVVGVGMPIVVSFSQKVTNQKEVEKTLHVDSTPAVEGAWRWFSSTEVHWRPANYWPSGTKVKVTADLPQAEIADGVWGKRTMTSAFTVGQDQRMTVDVASDQLSFNRNGTVVKAIPITTGKAGYRTRSGIKVVMDRQSEVNMDASTVGTDKNSPDYYNLQVKYAMRLTWSGEYLHAAPWSVGSQGHANVSHGCTGMSTSNALWLYNNVQIGDVVTYDHSSRPLEWGNGYTDWNKSFTDYAAGT